MLVRFCYKIVPKPVASFISCSCKSNYVAKEGRFMAKLIAGSSKKSKIWYPDTPATPVSIFSKPKNPDKKTSRRALVLNHVFMTHITELMTTGEYAGEIVDEKISVTKVKLHPDYKGVNVYWYKKSGVVNENTEILIKKLAGYLCHQLTSLRVIGCVPPITFVKDREYFDHAQVEGLLATLNLNNFEPVDPIKIDLGYETESKKLNSFFQNEELENEYEDPLPSMRHNVYGLEHSKIMNRLKDIVTKRNLVHSGVSNGMIENGAQTQVPKSKGSNYVEFDKNEYAKFLKKKRAEKIAKRHNFDVDDYHNYLNNDIDDDYDYDDKDDERNEWHQFEDER